MCHHYGTRSQGLPQYDLLPSSSRQAIKRTRDMVDPTTLDTGQSETETAIKVARLELLDFVREYFKNV